MQIQNFEKMRKLTELVVEVNELGTKCSFYYNENFDFFSFETENIKISVNLDEYMNSKDCIDLQNKENLGIKYQTAIKFLEEKIRQLKMDSRQEETTNETYYSVENLNSATLTYAKHLINENIDNETIGEIITNVLCFIDYLQEVQK